MFILFFILNSLLFHIFLRFISLSSEKMNKNEFNYEEKRKKKQKN